MRSWLHRLSADWVVPIIVVILGLMASGFVGYSSNDKETSQRITVVEIQQKNDGHRLERIEDKLDRILAVIK